MGLDRRGLVARVAVVLVLILQENRCGVIHLVAVQQLMLHAEIDFPRDAEPSRCPKAGEHLIVPLVYAVIDGERIDEAVARLRPNLRSVDAIGGDHDHRVAVNQAFLVHLVEGEAVGRTPRRTRDVGGSCPLAGHAPLGLCCCGHL